MHWFWYFGIIFGKILRILYHYKAELILSDELHLKYGIHRIRQYRVFPQISKGNLRIIFAYPIICYRHFGPG